MITALAGGTGGAKLVDGLATLLEPDKLTLVVNTGDDFEHLGLAISPDLDTVTYTLAGLANPQSGWGRTDETWNFLQTLKEFGSPVWFRLGDRDLALHVERTRRMKAGQSLSEITRMLCRTFGIEPILYPRRVEFFYKDRAFDINKAKRLLGYQPKVNLKEGLKRTAEWYRKEGLI